MQHQPSSTWTKIPDSLALIIILLVVIGYLVLNLQAPPQIAILLCIMISVAFGFCRKIPWNVMDKGIREGISSGIPSIVIFLLIGVLIAVWIACGTIPTMILYGFSLISADYFLVTVFIMCALVGTSIGSAFTTVATIGVAFLGMGKMLGIDLALIAGAIISGAFFGDKMSPLSDTTNLAPGVAKVDLFEHIRHLMWTTIPAFIISLGLYFYLGSVGTSQAPLDFEIMRKGLEMNSFIHWSTFLPPFLLFIMAYKRIPAIPALFVGIVSSLLLIAITQPNQSLVSLLTIMQNGFVSTTGQVEIDSLLSRGGIQSMLSSVSLILLALGLGGILYEIGVISNLVSCIQRFVKTRGRLIFSTAMSSFSINVLVGEQYLAIILPGRAFLPSFEKLGLARKNLSRVLEDAGTVVNPLVPWSVCGVFLTGVLGVGTLEYLPYAFFCLLCPIITVILGFTGIGVPKAISTPTSQEQTGV
ncbi:Na+/H+ antiporter NhaC [Brevibacillus laterosporus]|uniref:Na+/H+ antiporter NhaC n=1 Tax=Brevibacillus laterosporus TaxID=1465 RepID=A0A502HWL7_BRELA|nr:Na+/H+ antiporter NhaC [Brevibacillus laterosporus]QDX92755.1 Na+/H+ antiporter NhaC [Brevibacillus laterosporus]TPG77742.1 Na+/H+ antiporter NhaC [Brevibacillus laterosporus]